MTADNFQAMVDGWRSIADSRPGTPISQALLDACNEAEYRRGKADEWKHSYTEAIKEREAALADVARLTAEVERIQAELADERKRCGHGVSYNAACGDCDELANAEAEVSR